ncbi:unnamed protein product [Parnassius mnemosyne]|uniref:Enamelin n=1 Tax=Parnassius mnemosyne TaxID=213953 RepID=A0AAV1KM85_9NEOP
MVYIAALIAVCSAAKLDRTYLPPASAKTAGGSSSDIQAPLIRDSISEGQSGLPKGAFDNDFDGVVVEAAAPGTRGSSPAETGLGAPRISYGSSHSKVGEAAFKTINQQGVQTQIASQFSGNSYQVPNSNFNTASQRPQAVVDRASNIVRFQNEVRPKSYNYAFETDNGIKAEENGVTNNGVEVQGGYSYTGDDGKLYKVTYTAGEGGYQPIGDHLPTSPPIPDEILKSLEQNAKEAAAGFVDDGSYDAAKYNAESEYTESDNDYDKYKNIDSGLQRKPELDADVSGTLISQNNQELGSANVKEQFTSYFNHTPEDTNRNNVFGSFTNNNYKNDKTLVQQLSETSMLEPISTQNTLNRVNSNKNTHVEMSNDDEFSRPIYFGSIHSNQVLNKGFGIKNSYLPPSNIQQQFFGYKSEDNVQNSTTLLNFKSSPYKPQHINGNMYQQQVGLQFTQSFLKNNFNQNNPISNPQNHDQFKNNNNIELNKNSDSHKQSQSNLQSTFQPQTELTTPFEDSKVNVAFHKQKQNMPIPSQLSFLSLSTSNIQPFNVAHSIFAHERSSDNSNNNVDIQSNPAAPHLVSNGFQEISNKEVPKSNDASQYQSLDHSYFYNQPSKPFEASYQNNEENISNFNSVQNSSQVTQSGKNNLKNLNMQLQTSTKYPRLLPIAPTVASFSKIPYNENLNTPNDIVLSENGGYGASTNYPKAPTIGNITPYPTKSTDQDSSRFLSHSTGITQAAISPFPSLSPVTNIGPVSNIKQPENFSFNRDISQSSFFIPSTALPQEIALGQSHYLQSNNKLHQTDSLHKLGFVQQTSGQIMPEFNNIGNTQSQQYDGEVYEYNKPDNSLSSPSQSEKENQPFIGNSFAEFGQKLQPSFDQIGSQRKNQNEYDNISQIKSHESQLNGNNIQKQPIIPLGDSQITNFDPSAQTKFATDVFTKSQENKNYKVPFEFSNRIKPCCQGYKISSSDRSMPTNFQMSSQNSVQSQQDSNFGEFEKLEPLSTDYKPGSKKGTLSTQNTGLQNYQGFQSAQITSQSSQAGSREDFSGSRRPPGFDKASGYYY